jgi:hypothetical protein
MRCFITLILLSCILQLFCFNSNPVQESIAKAIHFDSTGQIDSAKYYNNKSISLDSSYGDAFYNLALIYSKENLFDSAYFYTLLSIQKYSGNKKSLISTSSWNRQISFSYFLIAKIQFKLAEINLSFTFINNPDSIYNLYLSYAYAAVKYWPENIAAKKYADSIAAQKDNFLKAATPPFWFKEMAYIGSPFSTIKKAFPEIYNVKRIGDNGKHFSIGYHKNVPCDSCFMYGPCKCGQRLLWSDRIGNSITQITSEACIHFVFKNRRCVAIAVDPELSYTNNAAFYATSIRLNDFLTRPLSSVIKSREDSQGGGRIKAYRFESKVKSFAFTCLSIGNFSWPIGNFWVGHYSIIEL